MAQLQPLISQPKAWIVKVNQYAYPIYRFLRTAVPVAGAVADLALDQKTLNANHELDQVKVLLAELQVQPVADDSPPATGARPKPMGGADLREVRDFIVSHCGPRFGGLERVPAPTGEYLWICPDHHASYDPGLPIVG